MSTGLREQPAGLAAEARPPTGARFPRPRPHRRAAHSWSTTPGRLTIIAVALIVLIMVAGVVAAATAKLRADATADLVERHEPTAATVQEVYRALSDADATAAVSFLAAGAASEGLRTRFEDDIAVAGPSLSLAGLDLATDADAAGHIGVVGSQLPVYTGLVETARANDRHGMQVGAAYLREASHLMRTEILPAAEELDRTQRDRVAQAQQSVTAVPYVAAALAVVVLVALVLAQVHVRRLAKRRYNFGLVVATVVVLLGVLWSSGAFVMQTSLVDAGQRDGTAPVDALVESRIAALKARADELLTLVARGDGGAHEEEFHELTAHVVGEGGDTGLLGEVRDAAEGPLADRLDDAMDSAGTWLRTHEEVRELDDEGNHAEAVALAIDAESSRGGATAFTKLDEELAEAIWAGRQNFVEDTVTGKRALTLLAPGWLVIAAVAVAGVVVGIRQRLREYR